MLASTMKEEPTHDEREERTIRIELHCHSDLSDGYLPPEELAERLAATGVQIASLTDHDITEGLERFQKAASQKGVACVPGVEITADYEGREIHLLAYGFDPSNGPLQAALETARDHGLEEIWGLCSVDARGASR